MAIETRPTFLGAFLDATRDAHQRDGWSAVLPYWLLITGGIGCTAGWIFPEKFWTDVSVGVSFYGAILTLNGLLLALAWSAFAKIYESICSPKFSEYLRVNGVLSQYLFHVSYTNLVLMVSVVASASALVLTFIDLPTNAQRIALGAAISASAYALREASSTISLVHDLIWYKSIFDSADRTDNVTRLR